MAGTVSFGEACNVSWYLCCCYLSALAGPYQLISRVLYDPRAEGTLSMAYRLASHLSPEYTSQHAFKLLHTLCGLSVHKLSVVLLCHANDHKQISHLIHQTFIFLELSVFQSRSRMLLSFSMNLYTSATFMCAEKNATCWYILHL